MYAILSSLDEEWYKNILNKQTIKYDRQLPYSRNQMALSFLSFYLSGRGTLLSGSVGQMLLLHKKLNTMNLLVYLILKNGT